MWFNRVGGDAADPTFIRSALPVVYAVVVPALRKVREGQGTHSSGGFCIWKAGPPGLKVKPPEKQPSRKEKKAK
jgi:hypothetical protein